MFELIDKIKSGTKLTVSGEKHETITKTVYVTEAERNNWYAKVVFEDHSILVIAPFDNFMYFGRIQNIFGNGNEFENSIEYNGKKFDKTAEDYQIVKSLVFGDPLVAEGEVRYADYASEYDDSTIISLAVVSRTGNRADVIAKVLDAKDVILEK